MKAEKNQKNQLVVLCVLVVVVVGFGVYRMMGASTSANSPVKAPVSHAQTANPAAEVTGDQAGAVETQALVQAVGFVKPAKDPFTPQVAPSDSVAVPAQTTRTQRLPLISRSPGLSLPVMPSFGGPPGGLTLPPVVQVDPTKDMALTGVVEGEVNVAVIHDGDSRHIVREGQSLNGGLVVRSITRSGVRLSGNGRSYFLALSTGKGG